MAAQLGGCYALSLEEQPPQIIDQCVKCNGGIKIHGMPFNDGFGKKKSKMHIHLRYWVQESLPAFSTEISLYMWRVSVQGAH